MIARSYQNAIANRNLVQISSMAWVLFIGFTLLWCLAYSDIVLKNGSSFSAAFYCVMQNWVLWVLLTPAVFRYLDRLALSEQLKRRRYLVLGFTLVCLALLARIFMESVWGNASAAETLTSHLHEYTVAAVVILSAWRLILFPRLRLFEQHQSIHNGKSIASINIERLTNNERPADNSQKKVEAISTLPAEQISSGFCDKLWVHKGADRCLIAVDNIHYICAARNYVELFCQGDSYLLRSTLNDLEKSLPAIFTRTHRSIIVNIQHIERVKYLPSGSGTAVLRCGNNVPVSKRYLAEMRKNGSIKKSAEATDEHRHF